MSAPGPSISSLVVHGRRHYESFNSKLRDELLDGEIFDSLREAEVLSEAWRRHYNTAKPHSSLGYRPQIPRRSCPEPPQHFCGRNTP